MADMVCMIMRRWQVVVLSYMGGRYMSAFPSPPAMASSTSLEDDLLTLCLSGTRNPGDMFVVLVRPVLFIFFCIGHPPSHAMVVSCLFTVEELSLRDLCLFPQPANHELLGRSLVLS